MNRLAGRLLVVALLAATTAAADLGELVSGGIGTVAAAVDPETLRLDDGRSVRLAGIDVPKRAAAYDPNYAAAATYLINQLTQGRQVELLQDKRKSDRHGRLLAQLRLADGDGGPDDWLQGALLARGLARVMSLPGNTAAIAELLRIEAAARAAGIGLWSDPNYQVLTPAAIAVGVNGYQIVEGMAVDAAFFGGRGYLNFGDDYKTDFTITYDARARRLFEQAGLDPLALKGRRIRARGWLEYFNGPMIELSHPEQIEVLE